MSIKTRVVVKKQAAGSSLLKLGAGLDTFGFSVSNPHFEMVTNENIKVF